MAGSKSFGLSRFLNTIRGVNAVTEVIQEVATLTPQSDTIALTASQGALLTAALHYSLTDPATDTIRRALGLSTANIAANNYVGALIAAPPPQWAAFSVPAAAAQATASRASAGAGIRNICNSISARLIIPAAVNQPVITLSLRDGATGAGTVLWSTSFGVGAAVAATIVQDVNISGLMIPGTAATAMTLEFSAAGAATTIESVAITGTSSA